MACPSEALAKGGEIKLNFDLKKFLKNIKLNENNISMVLGGIVIVIVAMFVVNYFKDKKGDVLPALSTQKGISKEYTVEKGDTLWAIAENAYGSGYNWTDIKTANNLKIDSIDVGQKLVLPDVATKEPTATTKIVTEGDIDEISGDSYTVEDGDTLWNISVRAYGDGYQWVKVAQENNLDNPNVIHVGNVLTLPR